ncbi:hypothetical protein [Streptomyces vinaceus]|uniref:hypothetical protein n=1 Tax=Streptomyces vinaceus TaxID=1960 RepID=UPI00380B6B40
MPQEYLEGRTTDPATWMTSPQNLARIAALTRAAEVRLRTVEEQADQTKQVTQQAPAVDAGGKRQRRAAGPGQAARPGGA